MKQFKKVRWFFIIITNLFFIISIFKAQFIDDNSGSNGIFSIIVIFFIIGYNLYLLFINYLKSFFSEDNYLELFTTILTSLPTILIIYLYLS